MPIYEFYCSTCHTLLNFFSPTVDTERRPRCPHCDGDRLERRPARFATLAHAGGADAQAPDALDDDRMERALAAMDSELEALGDEEDPRTMARLMRRFGDASGLELGPGMESLLERLEAGEDPERVEEEMAALDESDDLELVDLFHLRKGRTGRRSRAPRVDETLYFFG